MASFLREPLRAASGGNAWEHPHGVVDGACAGRVAPRLPRSKTGIQPPSPFSADPPCFPRPAEPEDRPIEGPIFPAKPDDAWVADGSV